MRQLTLICITSVAVMAMLVLGGNANDGGCGGGVNTAEKLCQDSGGFWETSCPTCWPPQCGEPQPVCAAVCGTEPMCKCPASKPYWEDGKGCLSLSQCPATSCGPQATCDTGTEICVVTQQMLKPVYQCKPAPAACNASRSCGCLGSQVCTGVYDNCWDDASATNTVNCSCPAC